jgi:hypothetical protein
MSDHWLQDSINQAGVVATASAKGAGNALLIGIVPLISFGLLLVITTVIVAAPIKIINRLVK